MKNALKQDWAIATRRQKVAFIFVCLGILMVGGMGIFFAVKFGISALHTPDYRLAGYAILFALLTWPLAKIKIMTNSKQSLSNREGSEKINERL